MFPESFDIDINKESVFWKCQVKIPMVEYYEYIKTAKLKGYAVPESVNNTYMQLLAETGLVGFAFLLLFFIYVLFKLLFNLYLVYNKKILSNFYNFKTCILLVFFINFFPLVPNGNFFNNWLSIMYYLPVGFYLYILSRKS